MRLYSVEVAEEVRVGGCLHEQVEQLVDVQLHHRQQHGEVQAERHMLTLVFGD